MPTESPDEFLKPSLRPSRIRRFVVRSALLEAVEWAAPRMSGTLIDVGCGSMPYRDHLRSLNPRITSYTGIDLPQSGYGKPDLEWNGKDLPLPAAYADTAMATEVLEHCPRPEIVLQEVRRVLKPGGFFFFTVPFLWPLHCTPYDEYRYTPFSLRRLLTDAGFTGIHLEAMGGYNRALALMLGLYFGRPSRSPLKVGLQVAVAPVIKLLYGRDQPTAQFVENQMITGLRGYAQAGPTDTVSSR